LLHFWFVIIPKGSKEGTKFRVKNKSKKKNRFKGKRFSDVCEDGDVLKESHVHGFQI
jgi:hypothetical protein